MQKKVLIIVLVALAALAGVLILREPPYVPKFIGVATIFAGLVLVALR